VIKIEIVESLLFLEVIKLAQCVECNAVIEIPTDAVTAEIVDCSACGVELEIVNPETGELRVSESEGEDWGE